MTTVNSNFLPRNPNFFAQSNADQYKKLVQRLGWTERCVSFDSEQGIFRQARQNNVYVPKYELTMQIFIIKLMLLFGNHLSF